MKLGKAEMKGMEISVPLTLRSLGTDTAVPVLLSPSCPSASAWP